MIKLHRFLMALCIIPYISSFRAPNLRQKFKYRDRGEETGNWLIKGGESGTCSFIGYKPGGNVVTVQKVKAPTVTLQKNMLSTLTKAGSGASKLASTTLASLDKFQSTFLKPFQKFAPVLGMFGAVFGMISGYTTPTPRDILDAVERSFSKLTDEVNERLDEMKGYVDQKILQLEKQIITREYKALHNLWTICLDKPNAEYTNDCLRRAYDHLKAKRPHFLLLESKMKIFNMKNRPSVDDVKKMEVSFLTFRDYVLLNMMELKGLVDTYREDTSSVGRSFYKRYLSDTLEIAQDMIDYARFVHYWIFDLHDIKTRYSCKDTIHCTGLTKYIGGGWSTKRHMASHLNCKCTIHPSIPTSKSCTREGWVRVDYVSTGGYTNYNYGNVRTVYGAARKYAADHLLKQAFVYWSTSVPVIRRYWDANVMDLVPSWEKIRNEALLEQGKNAYRVCPYLRGIDSRRGDAEEEFVGKSESLGSCSSKCIEKNKEDEKYNGAKLSFGDDCYCSINMTRVIRGGKSGAKFYTCLIKRYLCVHSVDNIGAKRYEKQLSGTYETKEQCIQACVDEPHSGYAGVSYSPNDKSCYCQGWLQDESNNHVNRESCDLIVM